MTSTHLSFLRERILKLLERWVHWAEGYWFNLPDYPLLGYWGTGYNHWGVQTNQKYLAAVATLSSQPEISPYLQEKLRQHALSALRFSLQTHVSGTLYCMDGTSWGHTWISTLGIERMMHGVSCLQPFLSEEDLSILSRVLISEADWLIFSHERNGYKGISASKWEKSS